MTEQEMIKSTVLELRRGVLVIAVLSQLEKEQYGYSLLKCLSDQGLEIDQGTLYPLLRRLESQHWLQSDWRIADEARPRRYYVLSPQGHTALEQLKQEWAVLVTMMQSMLFQEKSE